MHLPLHVIICKKSLEVFNCLDISIENQKKATDIQLDIAKMHDIKVVIGNINVYKSYKTGLKCNKMFYMKDSKFPQKPYKY